MEKRSGFAPENAEMCFKCSNCGNMFPITASENRCDVCGLALGASNEGY